MSLNGRNAGKVWICIPVVTFKDILKQINIGKKACPKT